MCDLTYLQVLELNNKKRECIKLGKRYEKEKITYDKSSYSEYEINFIEFGRFCEYHNLNSGDLSIYDKYLECDMANWNINHIKYESLEENQIYVFFNRIRTGVYKAIIANEITPILNDERNIQFWVSEALYRLKSLEIGYDTIKIIKLDDSEIFFEGLEEISEGEIILREFLDKSYDHIIIKDSLTQIEFRDENIKDIDLELLNRCKNVINIRKVSEDSEHYNMNWDCLLVRFKDQDKEEIWQPC
ncbi:hypothetical protein [Clostridium beijerinckii]|uniref:hypothetical protein n=1 Tax=Clostridium beijerinckii TaxID=1520 RepID=UPI00156F912F|nr:hypothetical protein [Clostridium beijerinckii]NRU52574.1 hypothetical protein [Clostridium beijerinckii]NYC69249.1 hypothetical protein [Clostridium beijerinckii]NYC91775.1 hypothetical protein [Clostridium beijerinckii]